MELDVQEKSDFAGNLQQTFKSFCCLERKTQLLEKGQTERNQRVQIVSSDMCFDDVENPGADTSSVKLTTFLQGAPSGVPTEGSEVVVIGTVEVVKRSGQVDVGVCVSEYFTKKLQTFIESGLSRLVNLGEDSVAQLSGEEELQGRVAVELLGYADVLEINHDMNNLTSMNVPKEARR